jgi:hypothetical protein
MEDNLDDDPDYSGKPSDGHLEKEDKKKKSRPKVNFEFFHNSIKEYFIHLYYIWIQTFEEYLSELGLENFGVKDRFLCHLCPEEFSTSTRMLNHIKNVHESKDPQPHKKITGGKCKFCNSVRQLYCLLQVHQK